MLSMPKKYSLNIGNGSATTINVAHGLATTDVVVSVWEIDTKTLVECDITYVDTNNISLTFAIAPTSNQYRVVIIG